MKALLLLLLATLGLWAQAGNTNYTTLQWDTGTSVPGQCKEPGFFVVVDVTFYYCVDGHFHMLSTSVGSVAWGAITGTLSAQTDLQTALNSVASTAANASNLTSGTLNHARLPTLLSGDIPNNAANTSGTAAKATALAATPAQCSGGTPVATGIAANGDANCAAASGGSSLNVLPVSRTDSTHLSIGAGCAPTTPCNVRTGQTVTSITSSSSVSISAGSALIYIYVTASGSVTVGSTNTMVCTGCTFTGGVTDFPVDAIPLYTWSATSGTVDISNSGGDARAFLSNRPLTAGAGVSIALSGPSTTISLDPAYAPIFSCDLVVGDQSGSAILDAQLGPQKHVCKIPSAASVVEIDVSADAGSPSVQVGRRRCTTFTTGTCSAETVVNLLSGALAASSGFEKCSNAGGTTGRDGGTTCTNTLQNGTLLAGDWVELVSGTAGGTAKLVAVHVIYTTP